MDAAEQKRHGLEKRPHELDFGLRDRLLVLENRVEHIDIGAFEDFLLVGHDHFERFDSFQLPRKPPNEIPSTPLHRLMISVISVELTGIRSFAKNCYGSLRGKATYLQVFLADRAGPIAVDDAEIGENEAFLEDFVHVLAMANLEGSVRGGKQYQEDVEHDVHGLEEQSDPVVVLYGVAPRDGIVIREKRDFEEVSIDDPVLRETIDDAVVLAMKGRVETHAGDEDEEVDRIEGDDESGDPLGSLEEEVAIADLMRRGRKGLRNRGSHRRRMCRG